MIKFIHIKFIAFVLAFFMLILPQQPTFSGENHAYTTEVISAKFKFIINT
ncbi:hypothetical protein SAMN06296427_11210 [Moheibacter sediminis]|uniref:Uncharacterized protein n=1 Tax=Moheibacter sediminis TaxID=1434700 RepID=A0A1W2CWS8_9FLAO|nr:hypothetical protein SAMN06296427_11210 [Moheibacter sediminis]